MLCSVGHRNGHQLPPTGAELGPNLGPNLPETNQDHSGLLGTRGARRANKSALFETGSDERGSPYAVSKFGRDRFDPSLRVP